jgi:hypothetical protein
MIRISPSSSAMVYSGAPVSRFCLQTLKKLKRHQTLLFLTTRSKYRSDNQSESLISFRRNRP